MSDYEVIGLFDDSQEDNKSFDNDELRPFGFELIRILSNKKNNVLYLAQKQNQNGLVLKRILEDRNGETEKNIESFVSLNSCNSNLVPVLDHSSNNDRKTVTAFYLFENYRIYSGEPTIKGFFKLINTLLDTLIYLSNNNLLVNEISKENLFVDEAGNFKLALFDFDYPNTSNKTQFENRRVLARFLFSLLNNNIFPAPGITELKPEYGTEALKSVVSKAISSDETLTLQELKNELDDIYQSLPASVLGSSVSHFPVEKTHKKPRKKPNKFITVTKEPNPLESAAPVETKEPEVIDVGTIYGDENYNPEEEERKRKKQNQKLIYMVCGFFGVVILISVIFFYTYSTSARRTLKGYLDNEQWSLAFDFIDEKYEAGQDVDTLVEDYVNKCLEAGESIRIVPAMELLSDNYSNNGEYYKKVIESLISSNNYRQVNTLIDQMDNRGGEYEALSREILSQYNGA